MSAIIDQKIRKLGCGVSEMKGMDWQIAASGMKIALIIVNTLINSFNLCVSRLEFVSDKEEIFSC